MSRIEFKKGTGGIVNIINGYLKELNVDELPTVEDVDAIVINPYSFSPIGYHYGLKALEIGGYVIVFDSIDSWKPYLDQIDIIDGEIFNPGITGPMRPTWDLARDPRTGIVNYTIPASTDIEQDYINKRR